MVMSINNLRYIIDESRLNLASLVSQGMHAYEPHSTASKYIEYIGILATGRACSQN